MDTVQGEITLERLVAKLVELEQEHAELRRENERIGEELATLSKEVERRASIGQPTIRPLVSGLPQDPSHQISRRGVLRTALTLAAAGAAGLASGERADTQVAAAATADTNFVANGPYGGSGIAIGFNAPKSASFTLGVYGYGTYAGVSGEADQSYGVVGKSNTGAGVAGISFGSNANGVIGTNTNYTGVAGKTGSSSNSAAGVYGVGPFVGVAGQVNGASGAPGAPVAIFGTGVNVGAIGVWGASDSAYGVFGQSTSGRGVVGASSSDIGVFGVSGSERGVVGQSTNSTGVWGYSVNSYAVYCHGNFAATGTKSAIVPHPDGSCRKLYCLESPETWFEDFGVARLMDGTVTVQLDPDFTAVVRNDAYHIFLTPQGDSNGLYVSSQSPTSFTVKEQHAGTSTLPFSYRVVAKRKDVVAPRMERVTLEEVPKPPDLPANEKYSKTSNRDAG
jgi:hypothetical protein